MVAETVKATAKIGSLARKLTPNNQSYILNTINALLYSQETSTMEKKTYKLDKSV